MDSPLGNRGKRKSPAVDSPPTTPSKKPKSSSLDDALPRAGDTLAITSSVGIVGDMSCLLAEFNVAMAQRSLFASTSGGLSLAKLLCIAKLCSVGFRIQDGGEVVQSHLVGHTQEEVALLGQRMVKKWNELSAWEKTRQSDGHEHPKEEK